VVPIHFIIYTTAESTTFFLKLTGLDEQANNKKLPSGEPACFTLLNTANLK
jgi:hypothetical protein